MKTRLLLLITLLMALPIMAQNGINYKAIVKDDAGNIIANDLIVVQFEIREGSETGTVVYQESHTTTTDANGIIVVNIGEGTPITGTFGAIDWASDPHFLNVQVNTGAGLVDLGTTEFKAVPYALAAGNIELPFFGSANQSGAAFHAHNDFISGGRYGLAGSVGTDGETLPSNNAGVMGNGVGAHGVYGFSKTSFFAGVQGVSDSPTGVGVQGYGFGGGVGGHFYTTSSGVAALTTGVGNVGIGIGSPANPLSVLQSTGAANTVRIESEEHPSGKDLLELQIPDGSSATSQFIEMQNGATIVAVVNGDGSARFSQISIDGIGTGKLHINQNSQTVGTGLRFDDGTANSDWDITHGFALRFHYGGVLKGFINATTGAYTQSSDVRLKNNIAELTPVLNRVDQLRAKTYSYNNDEKNTQVIGMIAQEVQKIFPEVVSYSEVDDIYGIDYAAFSVVAIKAIQEQQAVIKSMEERLLAIEDKIKD